MTVCFITAGYRSMHGHRKSDPLPPAPACIDMGVSHKIFARTGEKKK